MVQKKKSGPEKARKRLMRLAFRQTHLYRFVNMWRQDNRDVFAFSLSWFEHSKGVEDINYLVAYPPWFIPLNLNLRSHSELSIVILRLLDFILNFRSWADKKPHHFESELCIIPHLKIASNKRMCHSATPDRGTLKRVLGLGRQCNCTVCLFCCLSA